MWSDAEEGGAVSVMRFVEAAQGACNVFSMATDPLRRFLCLDLTIISSLLLDGLHFDPRTTVIVCATLLTHSIRPPLTIHFPVNLFESHILTTLLL